MKFRLSALILSLAIALPATAGQLYKWTDANGRVQYSDTPPMDRSKAESVKGNVSVNSTPSQPAAASSAAEQEQAFRKRQQERAEAEQKASKEAADKEQRQAQCTRARAYLRNLETGGRISTTDEKGERSYFDEAKIESEKTRIRSDIDKNCA